MNPTKRQFCERCGERLDPDAEGACGECGWIPPFYDDGTPTPGLSASNPDCRRNA